MSAQMRPGRAIFGGTFNPPHIGHFRLAVEAREALGNLVKGVEMVPCARPPHKSGENLLPFAMRCALLDACMKPLPWMTCNRMEALREGPSYTVDTLEACRAAEPGTELYFLLGGPDYRALTSWRRGLELSALCNFVVMPRGDMAAADFDVVTRRLWPDAVECPTAALRGGRCMELPGGGMAHFLPLPWLAVSASRIRELWLAGRSVEYLVPTAALRILERERDMVSEIWGKGA